MTTNKMQLFLIYLFLVYSTRFGRILRPSSEAHNCTYNFGYCQPILLLADITDEMEQQYHLINDISQQQYWLTTPENVSTVMCS
jgi:hypothetical protein